MGPRSRDGIQHMRLTYSDVTQKQRQKKSSNPVFRYIKAAHKPSLIMKTGDLIWFLAFRDDKRISIFTGRKSDFKSRKLVDLVDFSGLPGSIASWVCIQTSGWLSKAMVVVGQLRSHLWLVNGDDLRRVKWPAPTWNWGPIAVRNYVPRSAGVVKPGVSHLLPNGHLCTKITKIHLFETTSNVVKQSSKPMICANVLASIKTQTNQNVIFLGWMIIIRIIEDFFHWSFFSHIQ